MKKYEKEKKMLSSMSLMDDAYVEEAAPKEKKAGPFGWRPFAFAAVAACLVMAFVLPFAFGSANRHNTVPITSANSTATLTQTSPVGTPDGTQGEPNITAAATMPAPSTSPAPPLPQAPVTTDGWVGLPPMQPSTNYPEESEPFCPGVPEETESPYADSPYFPVIEQLEAYYESLKQNVTVGVPAVTALPDAGGLPDNIPEEDEGDLDFGDITDNQVEGVIEGDHIKRTKTHIFYMVGSFLRVYSIQGEDSTLVGEHRLPRGQVKDFYLLDGGNKALAVSSVNDLYARTQLTLLDVSDPASIKEIKTVLFYGDLSTSRVTEDTVLLITNHYISQDHVNYGDPKTFMPCIDEGNGAVPLSFEDIFFPNDKLNTATFGAVYALDAKTLAVSGKKAFLGGTDVIYVSKTHIYSAENFYDAKMWHTQKTNIIALDYTNGLSLTGKITLDGHVLDQYCMDEKDGVLRVVTDVFGYHYELYDPWAPPTTPQPQPTPDTNLFPVGTQIISPVAAPMTGGDWVECSTYPMPMETTPITGGYWVECSTVPMPMETVPMTTDGGVDELPIWGEVHYIGASLYCVSLEGFEIVASVERFAPHGESVQSVRFDGDSAYVCTSIRFTDPVFFFDLSDLSNITYTDTGVIEGYSSSLVDFGNGNLLGIGYKDVDKVKIEMYKEEGDKVVSINAFLFDGTITEEYKAYYIDRDNQLIGFACQTWEKDNYDGYKTHYYLLHFNGESFELIVDLTPFTGPFRYGRSVYIDSYLYVFDQNGLRVVAVTIPE